MIKSSKNFKILANLDTPNYVPVYIFENRNYTVLEAIIVYLKERRKLSFRKIASLINRDLRYTYNSYQNAKSKQLITEYKIILNPIQIPLKIFLDEKLPALESLVKFLKEENYLSLHEIAKILNRDDRTIWTVYQRARVKYGK